MEFDAFSEENGPLMVIAGTLPNIDHDVRNLVLEMCPCIIPIVLELILMVLVVQNIFVLCRIHHLEEKLGLGRVLIYE